MNSSVKSYSASFGIDPVASAALVTTGSSAIVATLPDASAPRRSKFIMIKKVDSGGGTVVITPVNSQTIDGASTLTLSNQWDSVLLVRDGANWKTAAVSSAASVSLPAMGAASGKILTNNGSAASWSGNVGVDFSVATSKFTVASASGNTVVAGTLGVTGDVAVATNKFTVAAASGNTVVAGTLAANDNVTVASAKTLAVTTADKLTVGGKIIPQTWTVKGISLIVTPATSGWAYIAPRACKVVSIKEVHLAGATGITVNLRKITDASAPNAAAGANVKELLSSALAADSTNNTVVTGSLSATAGDYTFAAGDKMAWNASGTLTSYAGEVTVEFQAV